MSKAKRRFYTYKQREYESNVVHVKNVKSLLSVVEHYDGKLFEDEALLKEALKEAEDRGESPSLEDCKTYARNKCLPLEILKLSKYRRRQ